MFKFNLPKWSAIDVPQPSGATLRMIHVGNGEFVSELPPLALNGVSPANEDESPRLHPVSWDSAHIGPRTALKSETFVFDSPKAMLALHEAADRGDEAAIVLIQRLLQAQGAADAEQPSVQ